MNVYSIKAREKWLLCVRCGNLCKRFDIDDFGEAICLRHAESIIARVKKRLMKAIRNYPAL